MHSLLRITNILNTKHKKIKELTRNNIILRDRNNKEVNKSKNKILFKSITSRI
jgi:hypothetical protein